MQSTRLGTSQTCRKRIPLIRLGSFDLLGRVARAGGCVSAARGAGAAGGAGRAPAGARQLTAAGHAARLALRPTRCLRRDRFGLLGHRYLGANLVRVTGCGRVAYACYLNSWRPPVMELAFSFAPAACPDVLWGYLSEHLDAAKWLLPVASKAGTRWSLKLCFALLRPSPPTQHLCFTVSTVTEDGLREVVFVWS